MRRARSAYFVVGKLVFGHFRIVAGLEIHPEFRPVLEVTREAQCGVRSNPTPLVDDIGDPSHRDAQVHRHFVHAKAETGHKFPFQNFSGMQRLQLLSDLILLVVVHNFDLVRMPFAPNEANPPLVVNANAVLPLSVSF